MRYAAWRSFIVADAIVAGVTALGIVRFLAPPGSPPDYRGPKPEPDTEGLVTHRDSILIDAPLECYVEWTSNASLEEVLQGSDDVPRVVATEAVIGVWDQVGARRRVVLEDGNYAAEEILANDGPSRFRYQVWGYTSPVPRLMIDYAVGEFDITEEAGMISTRPFAAKLCSRRETQNGSYSTATTFRALLASERVNIPEPAPSSTTRSLYLTPASSTILLAVFSRLRKF